MVKYAIYESTRKPKVKGVFIFAHSLKIFFIFSFCTLTLWLCSVVWSVYQSLCVIFVVLDPQTSSPKWCTINSGLVVIKVLAHKSLKSQHTHKGRRSELTQITSVPVTGAFCPHHLRAYSCSCDRRWQQFRRQTCKHACAECAPPVHVKFS